MRFLKELDAIIERDPAARSRWEVFFLYPSFHVCLFHRFSHFLWRRRFRFLARWLMQFARILTQIEIHPGAVLGANFFIDHGSGVVIGETAEIGANVTLYQDVVLGGASPSEHSDSQRGQKRHPTLRDGVIVGSGAQILGPVVVGENARIGSNAVVVRDVAPGTTVVGIPAKPLLGKHAHSGPFRAYGLPRDVASMDVLLDLCKQLDQRLTRLEQASLEQAHLREESSPAPGSSAPGSPAPGSPAGETEETGS